MIANTSREVYIKLRSKLNRNQQIVYQAIKQNEPITNEKIADALGWVINKVTGRVNELVTIGMVEHQGYDLTRSKRRAKTWVIATPKHIQDRVADMVALDERN
jgi:hypothetical protein